VQTLWEWCCGAAEQVVAAVTGLLLSTPLIPGGQCTGIAVHQQSLLPPSSVREHGYTKQSLRCEILLLCADTAPHRAVENSVRGCLALCLLALIKGILSVSTGVKCELRNLLAIGTAGAMRFMLLPDICT
jgi:hypothetical protein